MTILPSGGKWAGRTECTAAESRVPRASGVHQHSEPPGQERLTYAGGHETLVVTGKSRTSGPGPGTADDLYSGHGIDARREDDAWLRPDSRTRTGPECTPWTTTTPASAPNPPPPVRRTSRLHPQRTWCSACGARRQHHRPDRGRPLHGDAEAHGTSDRTPRRPPEARPALRRPGPGLALDPARPGTLRRPSSRPSPRGCERYKVTSPVRTGCPGSTVMTAGAVQGPPHGCEAALARGLTGRRPRFGIGGAVGVFRRRGSRPPAY